MVQRELRVSHQQYLKLLGAFPMKLYRDWIGRAIEGGFQKPDPGNISNFTWDFDWFTYAELREVANTRQNEVLDEIFGADDCPYYDGEPVWVRFGPGFAWDLRYSDGQGRFYESQKKSGPVVFWQSHKKFDFGELPVND